MSIVLNGKTGRGRTRLKVKAIAIVGLALACVLGGGCTHAQDFDTNLCSIIEPYVFSIVKWEVRTVAHEANQWFLGKDEKSGEIDDEALVVTEYFASVKQIQILRLELAAINAGNEQDDVASIETELGIWQKRKTALENAVERILEKQIREVLVQEGIFNPADEYIKLECSFPPLNFKLEKPPHLLVISPRDRIESMREITLQQNLSREEMEAIEAEVDELGVSSLVVELGGLGATYPTFVTNDANLGFIINTATEEWVHQYLLFRPLGFLYLLDLVGVSRNYEIATMNETLAGMVSKEIGSMVYQKYYAAYKEGVYQESDPESEFNREMREIRKAVDEYLAGGKIEQAEEFMGQKRQYLASMGYNIRKLNQAYFAFHGTYADMPTSISPIGTELKELRSQSASLKDFLNTVANMTSHQALKDSLKEP